MSQIGRLRQQEVSQSLFSFLYAEIVRSFQQRVTAVNDLEQKLHDMGKHAGIRWLELFFWKERPLRRETDLVSLLQVIQTSFFRYAFGRGAESLEVSTDSPDDYMIIDPLPITNRFFSVPKDLSQLSPASWIAGILESMIRSSGFTDYRVSAHSVPVDGNPLRTVFLIRKQS